MDPQLSHISQFWEAVERLRTTLRLSDHEVADLLHLPMTSYHRRHEKPVMPSAKGLMSISREFDLDPRNFANGKVDWRALYARKNGDPSAIPERYQAGAFSRRRTSIHLLSYLGRHMKKDFVFDLLRHFDMTEAAFEDPDALINIHFLTDLTEYLVQKGASQSMLFEMGAEASRVNREAKFAQLVSQSSNLKEAFDLQVNHLMDHYDRNYHYRTGRLTDTFCTIEGRQSTDVQDALGVRLHGTANVCRVKLGVSASFPELFGLPRPEVKETRCVHRGDPLCLFEVDFSSAAAAAKQAHLFC